jgi:hypothetical protein
MIIGAQGGIGRCILGAEVTDSFGGCFNRADVGVATATKADDFPTDGILLVREFESDKVGCCKALKGDCGGTVSLCANKELDVLESKG